MNMANSYEGRYCGVCEHELHKGYFSLCKRSQTLTDTPSGTVVMVSDDELVTDFCGSECSEYAEAAITSTLTSPYPSRGKTVPCSLCLQPVDRALPHVSVNMTQFEDASQPWLCSARVVDERELAVYCAACAQPGRALQAFDESELGVAV
ncbi:conserved hypothetical protein [Burkholderia sp. 8Y]|nr:conserved hypothetical protein [Burkholderia sp. 8Y]